jgi:CBS-domain-containing membrane protein
MFSAKEEMTSNLVSVQTSDSLDFAYAKMAQLEIRHLPVIDETGFLAGIISDRDLQRGLKCVTRKNSGVETESCYFEPQAQVREFMSWPARTVDKNTHTKIVAGRMIAEKISSFLVTDQNKVVGIVTTEDLLKVLIRVLDEPDKGIRSAISDFMFQTSKLNKDENC